jgi:hypothetical protein
MKKILLILAIIVFSSAAVFAQNQPQINDPVDVTNAPSAQQPSEGSSGGGGMIFGAQIGFGAAFIKETSDNSTPYGYDPIASYSIGGRFGYFFGFVGVMVDLEYVKKGAQSGNTKLKLHYIDVDLMFAVKFGGFYAGVGLYTGFGLSKTLSNSYSTSEADNIRDIDFGWVLEGGFMFGGSMKFMLGLEIKASLMNILEDAGAANYNWKNISVMLKFGILIGN